MATYDPRNLWTIPPEDDNEPGVLLSDRILLYVEATHLIEPDDFDIQALRPASSSGISEAEMKSLAAK